MCFRLSLALAVMIVLGSMGCKPAPKAGEWNKPFVVYFNQTAEVYDPIKDRVLQLKFTELIEDSRCPEGAYCFWAGQAIIGVTVNGELLKLTAAESDSVFVQWGDYRLHCRGLRPYPTVKDKTKPRDRKLEAVLEIHR